MPRMSSKVKEYEPKSKKACTDARITYDAIYAARDVLFDIHNGCPTWGEEWYQCVEAGFYKSALRIVEQKGKGKSFIKAIEALNCLIDLTEHINSF